MNAMHIKAVIFDCLGVVTDGPGGKNTELLDYIRHLRGDSYKISMLSNIASDWIRESFLTPKEQELFDDMVLSFEVSMAKPDARIFQLACDRLAVSPPEVVFVDDSPSYCQAAQALGLQAIVFTDFRQMKQELDNILSNSR